MKAAKPQLQAHVSTISSLVAGAKVLPKLPFVVVLLILGLVNPLILDVGSLRLSSYRIILLVMFFPVLFHFLSKKAGALRFPDVCVILICAWSAVSFIVVHGVAEATERTGIMVVETLGAYLMGRCFIRGPEAFYTFYKFLFIIAVLVTPFAIYEAVTGTNLFLELFGKIGNVYGNTYKERRLGLDRVQGPFAHPIHWGVFFGALVGVTYYVLGYGLSAFNRGTKTLFVTLIGALALSSGPLVALIAQVIFIVWDKVLSKIKTRWYILAGLSLLAYFVVDLISTRNPFAVFISYAAFSEETAYNRLIIWDHGTRSIMNNPLFGVGYGDWVRPDWMSPSVDMFWILGGLRHGVIVWALWFLLFFWIFLKTAYAKITDKKINAYRTGYLSSLFGLFMAGWTVHYWDATLVFFMLVLASGIWMTDAQYDFGEAREEPENDGPRGTRYSRFPQTKSRTCHQTAGKAMSQARVKPSQTKGYL
jgi:O-antigen ligase